MKTNEIHGYQRRIAATTACLAIGWLCWGGGSVGRAQTAPANLSPGLQEVVKLTQAHMSDDVITTYVRNSGASYSLSADDILYLNTQGVSQNVISALLQSKAVAPVAPAPPVAPVTPNVPAPATPAPPIAPGGAPPPGEYVPPAPPPPGSEISLNYFQAQLAPYGSWVDVPPYGPAWRPVDAMSTPGWRPYFNHGHWEYTDAGWFWHSEDPYGDIVFHYGRWLQDFRYGWVWVPGYDWAPAWVAWRQAEGFAGWAPLPPGARFEVGVGLTFRGRFAADLDFGLAPDAFVFVGYDHFWEHDYRGFLAPHERMGVLFRSSLVINNYSFVEGRFVVEGLGRERMVALTHHEIRPASIVIRDERIGRAREVERTRGIQRVQEMRGRPGGEPAHNAIERRDDIRRPEPVAPGRGAPAAKAPEAGSRGGSKEAKDAKDSKDSKEAR
jgi:hypothetical protein